MDYSGDNKEDSIQSFVIKQNNEFNQKIDKLRAEIKTIEQENSELEADNGRLEKSITYLRGVTINEHAMNEMQEKNINELIKLIKWHNKTKQEYIYIGYIIICVAILFLLFPLIEEFYGISLTIMTCILHFVLNVFCGKILIYTSKLNIPGIVFDRLKEYQKLKSNQDYLGELARNC